MSSCAFNIFIAQCIFSTRPEGRNFVAPWSYHKYHYVPNGNRYKTNETADANEVLVQAALEFLPSVLARAPRSAFLVQSLRGHALQLNTADSLHEKRLNAAIASFEYLKVSIPTLPRSLRHNHLVFNSEWSHPSENMHTSPNTTFALSAYFN